LLQPLFYLAEKLGREFFFIAGQDQGSYALGFQFGTWEKDGAQMQRLSDAPFFFYGEVQFGGYCPHRWRSNAERTHRFPKIFLDLAGFFRVGLGAQFFQGLAGDNLRSQWGWRHGNLLFFDHGRLSF